MKEVKEDLSKWKVLRSWIRKLYTVKATILCKVIHRFSDIPIKFPMAFFFRNGKGNPQIHMELQGAVNN